MFSRSYSEKQQMEWYGALRPYQPSGSVSGTITPDANVAETQQFTLGGAVTIAKAINTGPIGTTLYLEFIQDATGGRAVTWGAGYRDAPAIGGGSATAGQRASSEFRWDGVNWQFCGGSNAFA